MYMYKVYFCNQSIKSTLIGRSNVTIAITHALLTYKFIGLTASSIDLTF